VKIHILGLDCPKLENLNGNVSRAVKELCLECEIEKITDILQIMQYRTVMSIPALAINGHVVITRRVPSVEEIKDLLMRWKKQDTINDYSREGIP